jgi:molybdenum cofactor cytidylyltransferase
LTAKSSENMGPPSASAPALAGIILAAGESSRMGRDKALLPLGPQTFVERLLSVLQGAARPIVVVLGYHADDIESAIARAVARTPGARVECNPDYRQGQLSSLKVALRALAHESVSGAILCLVDHPAISRTVVDQLRERFADTHAPIVIPSYRGRRGHPVLFAASLFPELLAAPVSEGARVVVHAHERDIAFVDTDDDSVLWDIDRPEDYEMLMRRWKSAPTP